MAIRLISYLPLPHGPEMSLSFAPEQGYWLRESKQAPERYRHKLCGAHTIPGAECPNCRKPLLLVLSLDTSDRRLILDGCPLSSLPLLYCWTCNLAQAKFFYRFNVSGIKLVKCRRGGVQTDFPYNRYPTHFPESTVDLTPLTADEQATIHAINCGDRDEFGDEQSEALSNPAHQIGGEPICYDRDGTMKCVGCGAKAPLLATITDKAGKRQSFTGNAYVQMLFFLCRTCWIVGAYQQCD